MNETLYMPDSYVFDHCTRFLARTNQEPRSSYNGHLAGDPRAQISEAWRFPVIDRHYDPNDQVDRNLVTFVFFDRRLHHTVELFSTATGLHRRVPLNRVADTSYYTVSVLVPKGQVHVYLFVVDGRITPDPINPQQQQRDSGGIWSRFFTEECRERLTFEDWEWRLVDRLTDHILPFRTKEVERWLDTNLPYRLDRSVGVVNFIDKILAREEAHRRIDYTVCLELVRDLMRARFPVIAPEAVPREAFELLYDQMAQADTGLQVPDWDHTRYKAPSFFLRLLRRHTFTGAFCHPSYGGNIEAIGWRFLEDRYRDANGKTLFDWKQAIEKPLGNDPSYYG